MLPPNKVPAYVTPEDLFRALQAILVRHSVRFQVAPFSAWAQVRT